MRLLVISDLHEEFWSRYDHDHFVGDQSAFDVVVAAGDIDVGMKGVWYLKDTFPGKQIVYVPGNHEYYHHNYDSLQDRLSKFSEDDGQINILNPGRVTIDGVTFIGATLWSNLKLAGYPDLSGDVAERNIADFKVIKTGVDNARFKASDMKMIHYVERTIIDQELSKQNNGRTVVVTHFVPSQWCIAPQFAGSPLNPYFNHDFEDVMMKHRYPVHIYGHTHSRMDQLHPVTGTRLVGNPRGYPGENRGPYPWKIVDV